MARADQLVAADAKLTVASAPAPGVVTDRSRASSTTKSFPSLHHVDAVAELGAWGAKSTAPVENRRAKVASRD
jgi:hypothetical protein